MAITVDWLRKYNIPLAHTLTAPLNDYVAYINESNLPSEVWGKAQSSDNSISNNSNTAGVKINPITIGANVGDYIEITAKAYTGNLGGEYRLLGEQSGYNYLLVLTSSAFGFWVNRVRLTSSTGYTQPPIGSVFQVRIERLVEDGWEFILNGSSLGVLTSSNNFTFDHIMRLRDSTNESFLGEIYSLKVSNNGGASETNNYNPSVSNTTNLIDTASGNNGTLVNFPAKPYKLSSNGGQDIRFSKNSDGTGQLACWVKTFDTQAQKADIRVKDPTLNDGDELWIWYDNANAVSVPVDDVFGRNAVWSGYDAYLPLSEDVNNTSGGYSDATGSFDATGVSMSLPSVDANIGKAQDFDGVNDFIKVPSSVLTNIETANKFLLSAWVKMDSLTSDGTILGQMAGGGNSQILLYMDADGASPNYRIYFQNDGDSVATGTSTDSGGALLNTWQLVHAVWTGSSLAIYVDGVLKDIVENVTNIPDPSANIDITIGSDKTTGNRLLDGKLHSVGLTSHIPANTEDYIATEYANQSSPSTFWGTGTAQDTTASGTTNASLNVIISEPSFSIQTSLSHSATIDFTVAEPLFTIQTSKTNSSIVSFNVPEPVFDIQSGVIARKEASLNVTISEPVFDIETSKSRIASVSYEVSEPVFDVQAVTLGIGASRVAITVPEPVFNVQTSVTFPEYNADVDVTVSEPIFSIEGGAFNTLTAQVNFEIRKPRFNAYDFYDANVYIYAQEKSQKFTGTLKNQSILCKLPQQSITGILRKTKRLNGVLPSQSITARLL